MNSDSNEGMRKMRAAWVGSRNLNIPGFRSVATVNYSSRRLLFHSVLLAECLN